MSERRYGRYFDGQRWLVQTRTGSSVRWARVLMMDKLGRDLHTDEHVHHINGDKLDDRIENLEVVDIRDHSAIHARERWEQRKARWPHAWSAEHACCVSCSTVDRKHQGRGLCDRCYTREAMRKRRARKVEA